MGGIIVKKEIPFEVRQKLDRLIRKSVEYSFSKYPEISTYISAHSQEMSEEVMRKHIDLYVNNFSLELGLEGKAAVYKLLEVYAGIHQSKAVTNAVFSEE